MAKKQIEQKFSNDVVNLAFDTISLGKQALVFLNTKRSAEKAAEDISLKIKEGSAETEELSNKILKALSRPTSQCERLARCVKKGIAFHHAGLVQKQKEMIEDAFKQNKIKIICCTPTLAAGVDLPAFRSIIRDLKRYGHRGLDWIPVLEYEQMSGRAGRPKYDTFGEAICIAGQENEKERIVERYIEGEPEEIYSKLAVEPVLRMYILSLVASEFVTTKKQLLDFFKKTFWAYQYEDIEKLEGIIDKMINLLSGYKFIEADEKEFASANEIGKESLKATLLGQRIAQLYIDPLTAHNILNALKRSSSKQVNEFSFLQMVSYTLELRPLLRIKVREYDTIENEFTKFESNLITLEPSLYDPEHDEFFDSVKTALFFHDWIDENDEEFLLKKYDVRPGEIRVKLERAEWLLYAAEEMAKLQKMHSIVKEIMKTRFRLRYGVREELLTLLRLEGIGRVRARKLYNHKIKDIGDVKKADVSVLAQLLGKNVAIKVKKQVGEDIEKLKVPERKRKGQLSLGGY